MWEYCEDVSLEYGGVYVDLSTFLDGYCSAVRITDLDSACGFRGAVLIEHVVINGTTERERVLAALRACSFPRGKGKTRQGVRHQIADALLSYGSYEPDESWDSYASFHTEIVQMEPDGPMHYEGWRCDKRLTNIDLRAYVESVHLRS